MINGKRNHHFISQTEQVFHARSFDVKAKKINRFEVLDKNKLKIKKTGRKGVSIANNLSFEDLYCFDFLSRSEQYNFEDTFGLYEEKYNQLVNKIISADDGTNSLYLDLFTYKWMNILRNPFCIKNTLYLFGGFLKFIPSDSELKKIYQRIDNGYKPQEKQVCEYFGITNLQYKSWLKLLFLVLSVSHGGFNTLEIFTRSMFSNKETSLNIFLFSTDKEATIFSDFGFTSTNAGSILTYSFPLTNSHYISYGFTNFESFIKEVEIEKKLSESMVCKLIKNKPEEPSVKKIVNDLQSLKSFNSGMIMQSNKFVFSKSSKPYT